MAAASTAAIPATASTGMGAAKSAMHIRPGCRPGAGRPPIAHDRGADPDRLLLLRGVASGLRRGVSAAIGSGARGGRVAA
jgi:hypothetical protein